MPNDSQPHVRVTMVGGTGSGKTTYLIGMYAEMSAGIDNYYLTSAQDTHVELTSAWSGLIEDGLLPNATDASKTFDFTFRYGVTPLLELEWIDYRGGAVRGTSEEADTAGLLERLDMSDSLYFTFDGALLAAVAANQRNAQHRLRAITGDYSNLLARIRDARHQANLMPPSIVLLVTKGDLLTELLPGDAAARRRQIRDWIAGNFAQALGPDTDSAICTVSLGEIGESTGSRVNAQLVDPLRIHKPMIFTLYTYYRRASMVFERQAALIREEGSQQASLLQQGQQGPTLTRLLSRKRLNELANQLGRTNAQAQEFAELAAECQNRTRILEGELFGAGVDMYIDGELLEAV